MKIHSLISMHPYRLKRIEWKSSADEREVGDKEKTHGNNVSGISHQYWNVVYVTCQMQSDKLFGKLKLMLATPRGFLISFDPIQKYNVHCNNHAFDRFLYNAIIYV